MERKAFTCFIVPTECYQRYCYTYKNAILLSKKYEQVISAFPPSIIFDLPQIRIVKLILLVGGNKSVDLTATDVAFCKSERVNIYPSTFDSLESFLNEFERPEHNSVSILIVTKDIAGHQEFVHLKPQIILSEDEGVRSKIFGEMKVLSSTKTLANDIGSLLEDMILKEFLKMIHVLEDILQEKHELGISWRESAGDNSLADKQYEGPQIHLEDAKQLYEDVLAMFYRSGKPIESYEDRLKILDKKVAQAILGVQGVTGVGYASATLNIFLDDSICDKEKENSEENLKGLLKEHKIHEFMFFYEKRELTKFAEVGSTVKIRKYTGALGGFAKLGERKKMCALLSRHVSAGEENISIENPPNSGEFTPFAKLMRPKSKTTSEPTYNLDIALAEVINEQKRDCDVRFKDDVGNLLTGLLCVFDDLKWLNRLPVHISRAARNTGLGVIIIPSLYMEEASAIYLKIEDRDANERFANPGDSGSIVCANDINGSKVHVIAMLIGSSNEGEVNNNSQIKRQYVAFRLVAGLDQLEKEQGEAISLYDE